MKRKITGATAVAMLGAIATPTAAMAGTLSPIAVINGPTVSIYGIANDSAVKSPTQRIKIPTSSSEVSHLWVNGKYISADKITSTWTYYTVTLQHSVNLVSAQVVDKNDSKKSRVEHKYVTYGTTGTPEIVSMSSLKPTTKTQQLTVKGKNDTHINLWLNGKWMSGQYSNGMGTRTYHLNLKPGKNVVTAEAVYGSKKANPERKFVTVEQVKSVKATGGMTDDKLALAPGYNTVSLEALDTSGNVVSNVSWSSSNSSVATVTADGQVAAAGTGTAAITVIGPDGKKVTFTVTVTNQPAPAQVSILSPVAQTYLQPGQHYTLTAQLEDSKGNKLREAGKDILFYFPGNSNSANAALPNGVSMTGASNGYVATTNSSGQASITVDVPSSAAATQSFVVDANLPNGNMSPAASPTVRIEQPRNYAVFMSFSNSLPSTVTSGTPAASMAAQTVTLKYVAGGVHHSNDKLQVKTSNPNVLALSHYDTNSSNTDTVTAANGTATLPSVTGKKSGTATITVTDLSNPSVSTHTETVKVTAGVPSANSTVQLSATSIAAGTPLTVSGKVEDANGNPVAGAKVKAAFDGVTGTATADSTGAYSITLTPTKAVSDGQVTVTAAGTTISTSADKATVGVPTVAISAPSIINAADVNTNGYTISGTDTIPSGDATKSVVVTLSTTTTSAAISQTATLKSGTWQAHFTPAQLQKIATGQLSAKAVLTTTNGNTVSATAPVSVDTVAPTVTGAVYNASAQTLTLTFDSKVDASGLSANDFTLNAGSASDTLGSVSSVSGTGTKTLVLTLKGGTITAGNGDTINIAQGQTDITDVAGNPAVPGQGALDILMPSAVTSTVNVIPTSVSAGNLLTVQGVVKDQAGNPVPGAKVKVAFDGVTETKKSDSTGFYSIVLMPAQLASNKAVTVTANGTTISTASDTASVTVGSPAFVMEVASVVLSTSIYQWTVDVQDAFGHHVTGLTYKDFTVTDTTQGAAYTGVSSGNLAQGDFTVSSNGGGIYTLTVDDSNAKSGDALNITVGGGTLKSAF